MRVSWHYALEPGNDQSLGRLSRASKSDYLSEVITTAELSTEKQSSDQLVNQ